jgi:hypothetical protein
MNTYESKCPVHRGSRRNLSLAVGNNGSVVLHCHHVDAHGQIGCSVDEIVGALGLRVRDLFPQSSIPTAKPRPSPKPKRTWPALDPAVEALGRSVKATTAQVWAYLGRDLKMIMAVARYETPTDKTYRPFHILPDGSWVSGDPPGLLPLFNLPYLDGTQEIWVCEGEKCCDVLSGLGLIATTSAHGAQSPGKTDWTPLAGGRVVIQPDNDAAGEGYLAEVLRLFKVLSPRPEVKVVRLPGLADGEDAADWLPRVVADGKPPLSMLQGLADAAPVVDWDAVQDRPTPAISSPVAEAPIPIPEWPDPPEDAAFHGLAGDVVRLIEPTSEADPVGVLLQFLVGFGNAIGTGLWVVADGHLHHANEYGVTVGDTSRARKGTAWRRVRPILAHVDPGWAKDKITSGLSSGEGLISEIRDPIFALDKKTGQWSVTDPGINDKRILVIENELGNVLRVLARDGNTLSGVLRQGWDGDDLRTLVKHSPARATAPHVSLVGHITGPELVKYLAHVEIFNGLGNRILWACVKRSKSLPFGGTMDDKTIAELGSRVALALDAARQRGAMDWTSSGRALWEVEYDVLTASRPGLWGASTARSEAHVLRLSMIYAALDRSPEIADTHVLAALALWRFCDRSAAYLFGGSVGDRDADAILDALLAKPDGMTRTEIRRAVFQDHKTSDDVARALALLLRFNLVRQEIVQTAGRNAERWHAVSL